MAKANQAAEPSMEEILASIRRIIADDDTAPAAPESGLKAVETPAQPVESEDKAEEIAQDDVDSLFGEPAADVEPADNVLELTEDLAIAEVPDEEVPADLMFAQEVEVDEITFEEPEPQPEPAFEPEPTPEPVSFEPDPVPAPEPAPIPEPAPAMQAAAPQEPAMMAQDPIMSPNTDAMVQAAFGDLASTILSRDARTLEDLVQEMLRPMLQNWLDTNLPVLVERMVRAEIERVARGGR